MEIWLERTMMRISNAQEAIRFAAVLQKKDYDSRYGAQPKYKLGDYVSVRMNRHPTFMRYNKLPQRKLPPCKVVEILSNG